METSVYKSTSWKALPWDQFRRKVFNLQCRIYDAIRKGDIHKTIKLQKCLIQSSYVHYVAIKELTDFNIGRKIPGIDGKLMLTSKEKILFVNRIREEIIDWKHSRTRKINIVDNIKFTGTNTIFSLPTVEDRIIQFIWKLALEPAHEAIFLQNSWGFRLGKTAWDIQKYLMHNIIRFPNHINKKLLIIDFSNSFHLIHHEALLNKLIFPSKHRSNVYRALKMGLLDGCLLTISYHYSLTNISFLLLNIAFHGLEGFCTNIDNKSKIDGYSLRYGTHLLYSFNSDEEELMCLLDNFFYALGFNLKSIEVNVFKSIETFDFLDWRFVFKPNGKVISYPNKFNWLMYKTEVKFLLKNSAYKIETRIEKIRFKTSIWYNYHCFCDFSKVNSLVYSLKIWFVKYLRFRTNISKMDRSALLYRVFSSTSLDLY